MLSEKIFTEEIDDEKKETLQDIQVSLLNDFMINKVDFSENQTEEKKEGIAPPRKEKTRVSNSFIVQKFSLGDNNETLINMSDFDQGAK